MIAELLKERMTSELPAHVAEDINQIRDEYRSFYEHRASDYFVVGAKISRVLRGTQRWRRAMKVWTGQRLAAGFYEEITWLDHLTGKGWQPARFRTAIAQRARNVLWNYVTHGLLDELDNFLPPDQSGHSLLSNEPDSPFSEFVERIVNGCLGTTDA